MKRANVNQVDDNDVVNASSDRIEDDGPSCARLGSLAIQESVG